MHTPAVELGLALKQDLPVSQHSGPPLMLQDCPTLAQFLLLLFAEIVVLLFAWTDVLLLLPVEVPSLLISQPGIRATPPMNTKTVKTTRKRRIERMS
jgi:hypothetical protein